MVQRFMTKRPTESTETQLFSKRKDKNKNYNFLFLVWLFSPGKCYLFHKSFFLLIEERDASLEETNSERPFPAVLSRQVDGAIN